MTPELIAAYKTAAQFFREHDDFLLLVHEKPDGDALGSVLGAAHLLTKLGKTFTLVNDDPIPDKFLFLPMADSFKLPEDVQTKYRSVISFDCGDRPRLGLSGSLIATDAALLNIDHHKTNDFFGTENLVDLTAAATCQIVYKISRELGLELSLDAATCLYTGLVTDTGGFRYSNTSEEVMLIAASLLKLGVQPYNVIDKVMETMTWAQVLLIRAALENLGRSEDGKYAWLCVTRQMIEDAKGCDEDVEGLVNYPRNVEGVEVGILFREATPGKVKVSFRSKYIIDVGALAQELGGGGHARASGCTVSGTMEEVKERVFALVKHAFQVEANPA
ncbi:DHH family phosphoesterase [Tumebacillus permanentifrigoris]|uniref:Phosphoesterase RecJ-like protein n=1 Tax=Tumebacillus permanentifrigoris TaxID=378543 RepID=A0A316D7L4_9BACL|nr:bifunctional oligoribonuclease/PAP phosphatase NrnA [Tumebacillus permanentifrigoris]PWK12666.1 phosphoesterase RecJ-like protein [Tumebacillus permanentifrigoris]